jgi:hypothetical protein
MTFVPPVPVVVDELFEPATDPELPVDVDEPPLFSVLGRSEDVSSEEQAYIASAPAKRRDVRDWYMKLLRAGASPRSG